MSGTFITKTRNRPAVGEKVIVFVDDPKMPYRGVWEGIVKVCSYDGGVCSTNPLEVNGKCEIRFACTVTITDPKMPDGWRGCELFCDYKVMFPDEAVQVLLSRIEEQKREISGLQKRMKIEREVLHGAMRAMTSQESVKSLADIVQGWVEKAKRNS